MLRLHSPVETVYGPSRGFALTAKQYHTAISTHYVDEGDGEWNEPNGGKAWSRTYTIITDDTMILTPLIAPNIINHDRLLVKYLR